MSKHPRTIPDRTIAVAVVDVLAESMWASFSPCAFYDDDAEMLDEIDRLLVERTGISLVKGQVYAYVHRRLMRICNHLESWGVLAGKATRNPDHQYIGEPCGWKDFWLANPSTAKRLRPDLYPNYKNDCASGPEWEMDWLLRRAYPKKGINK